MLEQLTAKVGALTGDGRCVALILPLIGLAMRCTRPCGRCRELAAEVERLRPRGTPSAPPIWPRIPKRTEAADVNPRCAGRPVREGRLTPPFDLPRRSRSPSLSSIPERS
jgi:hypothetical protein